MRTGGPLRIIEIRDFGGGEDTEVTTRCRHWSDD